jgi:predicted HicB family RNase H-like nuclease
MIKSTLTYKGFVGSVDFSTEDGVFFGKLEGIDDLVTFESGSMQELRDGFCYVVEEHIKDCQIINNTQLIIHK